MRTATVIKMLQMLFTKYAAKEILDACAAKEWKNSTGSLLKEPQYFLKTVSLQQFLTEPVKFSQLSDSVLGSLPMGCGDFFPTKSSKLGQVSVGRLFSCPTTAKTSGKDFYSFCGRPKEMGRLCHPRFTVSFRIASYNRSLSPPFLGKISNL